MEGGREGGKKGERERPRARGRDMNTNTLARECEHVKICTPPAPTFVQPFIFSHVRIAAFCASSARMLMACSGNDGM